MLLISIIGIFVVDLQTMIFMIAVYLFGFGLLRLFDTKERIQTLKIYSILFFIGALFIILCYSYMVYHKYEYLLVLDSYNAYIPKTEAYLENGSYFQALKEVWLKYTFLDRFQSGYFTYALLFAYLGKPFNLNFFVEQQISVLFIYPFVGILLYKLFILNGFDFKKSYKYSLLICVFSVVFFYSTLVLRDLHILFLYLLAIYFSFNKEFSFYNLMKIILVAFICMTFRVESGLFLLVLIPTYLLLTLHNKKQRNFLIYISLFILIGLISFSIAYYNQISSLFEANQENYVEGITEGSGVISSLQRVPIAGDLASIIYNGVQPLPFWSHNFWDGKNLLGGEVYNIMNFPKSISSLFNWFVIVYILFWLFSKGLRRKTKGYISKPLQYQLWIGLVFLYMQSAVIAQRRLMAYYCMFYILFFIIYNHIGAKDKKQITITAIFSFIALQIIGLIYLS